MIKTINAAYPKCPNLPKSVNVNTGKQSTTAVSFNDDGWGDATWGFTKLAAQIVELVHQFEKLERAAMEHSRVVLMLKKASPLYRMWWRNLMNGHYLSRTTIAMTTMTQTNMWVPPQFTYTLHLLGVYFSGHICLHFLYNVTHPPLTTCCLLLCHAIQLIS